MAHIFVGIDWADDHHDVYVTDDSAKSLDRFTITHSYQGVAELTRRLAEFEVKPEDILVAIECHQGLLIYSLLDAGYQVYLINPKAMSRYRDRYRMSTSKSDPKDAMVLANILRTDLHLHKPLPTESLDGASLKQLTRAHKSLVQHRVKIVNQMTIELKSYYPVVLQIFCKVDQEITLAFLEQYPTPGKAHSIALSELEDFLRSQRYTRPGKLLFIFESLQEPALRAPKELEEAHQIVILSYIPVLRSLLTQIDTLENKIALAFRQSPAYNIFSSLPAGGIITARLSGEIGSDKSRYPTPGYLQTDAGTAPVTIRSGKSIVVIFRWQCNKHLRDAFQSLARESVMKCPWARDYFAKQMKLGHKASRAYRALANRWVVIVWRMLQEGQPFSQARLEKGLANGLITT
jgi:transposase